MVEAEEDSFKVLQALFGSWICGWIFCSFLFPLPLERGTNEDIYLVPCGLLGLLQNAR